MFFKRTCLAAFFVATAAPAVALTGDIYDCTFKTSRGELLSERVVFVVDPKTLQSRAYDGIVHQIEGVPVDAKVTENTDKKLKVRWSIMFPFRSGQHARVDFRVAYFKGKSTAVMSSQTIGATNQYNARGTCARTKGEL